MNKSTISDFKWRLLDALSACKVPKHRLLSRGLFVCMRRCLCKWCLPKCFQVESTTVGSDTLLLDTTTQEHLIYSFPQLHYHNDEIRIRLSLNDDANNSGSTSVHHATWSSRFRPGPRSLLCWINPSSLPTCPQYTDPISNYHCTNINDNNHTKTDLNSSDQIQSSGPESYDLSNGVFGGLVLHLVDVNLDTTDNDSSTGCITNEDYFEDVENSPSVYNSRLQAPLSTKSNRMSTCCCKPRKPKKIIAGVWSSPQQFQTILVHPQMLTHHFPNRILEAIDCFRQVLLSTSANSSDNSDIFKGFKPSDFIRKLDISS